MPWHKEKGGGTCGPDQWAVIRDADGHTEGCHDSEADADSQLAAKYAEEADQNAETEDAGGDPSPGTPRDKRIKENRSAADVETLAVTDEEVAVDASGRWQGILAVEGRETGDGREFAPGSLFWNHLPLTLTYQPPSHGGVPGSGVDIGRIDQVWRDGQLIRGKGWIDGEARTEDGREILGLVRDKTLRGLSVDVDDVGADVEMVFPDEDDDDDGEVLLGGIKMIFHKGRVRGAALLSLPAFIESELWLEGDELGGMAASGYGALPTHATATVDEPWDSTVAEALLVEHLTTDVARLACAWTNPEGVRDRDDVRFIHHAVRDGEVGDANLTACSVGIGLLQRGQLSLTLGDPDRRSAYHHLAEHLRAAGREPPPLLDASLVAALAAVDEWRPPREWFHDPRFSVPVPVTVTDDGRVYGHAAQWGKCHLGFVGECVTPPHEDSHPYFMTGEVICSDGSRVGVGQITVDTGHAPLYLGASTAQQHYDDTGCAVADVAVGNDQHGIWVAGAIRPDVEAKRVRALRSSGQLSGDWRRIGGALRLVGLLAVNTPGFPVPRMQAMVSAGTPLALVAAGHNTVAPRVESEDLVAARVMRRMADELAARVAAVPTPQERQRQALLARVSGRR